MNELTVSQKISSLTGFKEEEISLIKNTVAKGTTDSELALFLSTCKSVSLNPLMKQIWCYKDHRGNLLVFAGRDGFLNIAQNNKRWNGMTSFEVCENDSFEIDVAKGIVNHKPNFKNRGNIIGAYCIVKPLGCELPTVEWADFKTYNKGKFVWADFPAEMIKKVAEIHALKKAFGIDGIYSDMDFSVKGDYVEPITVETKPEIDVWSKKVVDALAKYDGEDKESLVKMCAEKKEVGEFTVDFAQSIIAKVEGVI
jgi:recombination protein RecT